MPGPEAQRVIGDSLWAGQGKNRWDKVLQVGKQIQGKGKGEQVYRCPQTVPGTSGHYLGP